MSSDEADADSPDELDITALPPDVGIPVSPEPLTYAPWHKPRKQFVRRVQWAQEVQGLISALRKSGYLQGDTVRYLTLPGPDLLDVRVLSEVCRENTASLKYLGLCRDNESRQARLRRNISAFSEAEGDVLPYTFEALAKPNGTAMRAIGSLGSFHVINVDACQPLAKRDPNETGRLIDAIRTVIEHQVNKARHQWLLFITTVVQPGSVSENSLSTLKAEIQKNSAQSLEFKSLAISAIDPSGDALDSCLAAASSDRGEPFARMFSLGLTKWLIHLCEDHGYSVIGRKPYCYSTIPAEPFPANMVSLGFEFRPKPLDLTDQSGLTETQHLPFDDSGLPLDIRAAKAIEGMVNLDHALRDDPELAQSLGLETKDLLRQVGYPVDHSERGYDAWLNSLPASAT